MRCKCLLLSQSGHSDLFGCNLPRRIATRRNFSSNDVDVAAQVVHLIRESKRKTDMAHRVFNTLDLGLFFFQMLVVWIGFERSLKGLELAIPVE